MDRRKLIKSSLHKNKQSINQSSLPEGINSVGDKQISFLNSDIVTQEKSRSFHERRSDIKSSTLKSLNIYSREKNDPSKGRKRSFCESENGVSETDDLASKLLKVTSSKSKQLASHVSTNASPVLSQQETTHLSRNCVSMTNKFLDTVNPFVERSIVPKSKIADPSSSEEISDDSDLPHNERNVIKKKLNKSALDRSTEHIIQDINVNRNSPLSRKMCHESPIKTISKFYISQKKQDKSMKCQLFTESEKHKASNKEHSPEKQNFHVPSIFSNFLQKCGIVLTNGIYILSKFFCYIYIFFFLIL